MYKVMSKKSVNLAVSSYPVLPVVQIPNNGNFNKQNHCFSLRELVNLHFIIIAEIFDYN